jgi:intracellular sulfur oxidation DsrE/DsrF family protein
MKTLTSPLLVLIFLLALSTNSQAHKDKPKSITQKIQAALSAPKHLKNTSEKVTVEFVVNADGLVIEANAKTNNPDIKKHLENQFMGLNLCGLQPCVTNTIDVNFVKQ